MPAFAEWEYQTVRERSVAGQLRAREVGKNACPGQPTTPTGPYRHQACRRLPSGSFHHLQGHFGQQIRLTN